MNNLSATMMLCNAMCSSFFPDKASVMMALFNAEIDAEDDATPKDARILRVAISLLKGYVETSRSEGGISVSISETAIKASIKHWCNVYGLNAEEVLAENEVSVIEDGTHLW